LATPTSWNDPISTRECVACTRRIVQPPIRNDEQRGLGHAGLETERGAGVGQGVTPRPTKHNVDVSGSVEPQPRTGQSIVVSRAIATLMSATVGSEVRAFAINPNPINASAGATRRPL